MIKIKKFVEKMELRFVDKASSNVMIRRYMSLEEIIKYASWVGKITLLIGRTFGFLFLFWILGYVSDKYGFETAVLLGIVILVFSMNKD